MKTHFLYLTEPLTHHAVIDIAERRDFNVRQRSISFNVVFASATQSDDRDTDSVVRA